MSAWECRIVHLTNVRKFIFLYRKPAEMKLMDALFVVLESLKVSCTLCIDNKSWTHKPSLFTVQQIHSNCALVNHSNVCSYASAKKRRRARKHFKYIQIHHFQEFNLSIWRKCLIIDALNFDASSAQYFVPVLFHHLVTSVIFLFLFPFQFTNNVRRHQMWRWHSRPLI